MKICEKCGKEFEGKNRFCSRSCANSRTHSKETKLKISNTLKKKNKSNIITLICDFCEKEFKIEYKRRKQKCCSRSCAISYRNLHNNLCVNAGKKSARSQNRRSKNEVYFAELCENHFNNVLTNENIFNGWDADVIIEDIKYAILWNGIWHYKKITEQHSLEQVQNRDKLKLIEIEKCGYKPYIIKDMGGYDKDFVEKEFENFKNIF